MSSRNFPPSFWNSNYVHPTPPTHHQVSSLDSSNIFVLFLLEKVISFFIGFRPLRSRRRLFDGPVACGPLRVVCPRCPRTCSPRARLPPQHGAVRQLTEVTPAVRTHVQVMIAESVNKVTRKIHANSSTPSRIGYTTSSRRHMRWKALQRILVILRWQVCSNYHMKLILMYLLILKEQNYFQVPNSLECGF